MSVRAGDVLNIGTVGCENVWMQKACIAQRLQVGVLCVVDDISPIEDVRGRMDNPALMGERGVRASMLAYKPGSQQHSGPAYVSLWFVPNERSLLGPG